jgi:hypothetical protein
MGLLVRSTHGQRVSIGSELPMHAGIDAGVRAAAMKTRALRFAVGRKMVAGLFVIVAIGMQSKSGCGDSGHTQVNENFT